MVIFLAYDVKNATLHPCKYKHVRKYEQKLTANGHRVSQPQANLHSSLGAMTVNKRYIASAHEVHVFYDPTSIDLHLLLGMIYMSGKPLKIISGTGEYSSSLEQWASEPTGVVAEQGAMANRFRPEYADVAAQIANDIHEGIDNKNSYKQMRMAVDYWSCVAGDEAQRRVALETQLVLREWVNAKQDEGM